METLNKEDDFEVNISFLIDVSKLLYEENLDEAFLYDLLADLNSEKLYVTDYAVNIGNQYQAEYYEENLLIALANCKKFDYLKAVLKKFPNLATVKLDNRDENIFHLCAQLNGEDFVTYGVTAHPQALMQADILKQTPLHICSASYMAKPLIEAVNKNFDLLKAQNVAGETVLDVAYKKGMLNVVNRAKIKFYEIENNASNTNMTL